MQNTFFVKEVIANAEEKVSLIILSNKQVTPTLMSLINDYSMKKKAIIPILFLNKVSDIKRSFGGKNLYFVDCTQTNEEVDENIIVSTTPSDLTGIMMAIDSIDKKIAGEKIIIFDALNILEAYNEHKKIGRFAHALSNKTRLKQNTLIFITEQKATDPKIVELMKEFSDKVYDYSNLFISTITSVETK